MRQAAVTSIDELGAFRARFLSFLREAGLALDQAVEEVTHTRVWLEHEQRPHWEGEVRRRRGALDMARQQLLSARLLKETRSADAARKDFHRAERDLAASEEKLRAVRHTTGRYESLVTPKLKELDALRQFLTDDGPRAAAFLTGAVNALRAYAETPPAASPAPPAAAEGVS